MGSPNEIIKPSTDYNKVVQEHINEEENKVSTHAIDKAKEEKKLGVFYDLMTRRDILDKFTEDRDRRRAQVNQKWWSRRRRMISSLTSNGLPPCDLKDCSLCYPSY